MKLALTCNNYPPEFLGGTERVVQSLARGLATAGDKVIVICGSDRPHDGRDVIDEDDAGIPVFRVPQAGGEAYGLDIERPRLLAILSGLLQEHRIDVLHVHHWSHLSDGQVRVARELGLGCVVTLHDMWTSCARFFRLPPSGITCPERAEREPCLGCVNLELNESVEVVAEQMQRRDATIVAELAAAHAVFAPSDDCAQACIDHQALPPELVERGIEVLPHGLLDASGPVERGPLGLPLRVGTFGNLNHEKGVMDLVEAMAGVRAELHLFGIATDSFREEVTRRAAELGVKFDWHGAYDTAGPHPARQLDLAVFPSRCRETYGLVVDEALHHGTPVLVSDIGALPERVQQGGGLTVPPGRVDLWSRAIHELVDDRDAYHRLRSSIPLEFPTMADAVDIYRHAYSKAWARARIST